MDNHGLETHNDKICADTSTENRTGLKIAQIPHNLFGPNRPIIWKCFEKSSHHMSIVYGAFLHLL
jgi:hypothetical protein